MPWWAWVALAAAVLYAGFVLALVALGRREHARALSGAIPDCVRLVRRLLGDPRVPRRHKLAVAALLGYLLMPFDLVPDFIPVAGQLDDVVAVALVMGLVVRGAGPEVVREHWPGPDASLRVLLSLAGSERASPPRGDRALR